MLNRVEAAPAVAGSVVRLHGAPTPATAGCAPGSRGCGGGHERRVVLPAGGHVLQHGGLQADRRVLPRPRPRGRRWGDLPALEGPGMITVRKGPLPAPLADCGVGMEGPAPRLV